MKKYLILLWLVLLLSSCMKDVSVIQLEEQVPLSAAPPLVSEQTQYTAVLLVDEELDDVFLTAAQRFAKEVARLTDDNVKIEVRVANNTESAYSSGETQIVFLNSTTGEAISERFSVVSAPFLYPDYDIFTMAANSTRTKQMLEDSLRNKVPTVLLGGYYTPSYHFVSIWQPTSLVEFNQSIIAVNEGTSSGQRFALLGASSVEEPDPNERFSLLLGGYVQGAEFTLEELQHLNWENEQDVDFYLTLSYHTAAPVWLAISADYYESLPPAYQAAVNEASAYLYTIIDHPYVLTETSHSQVLVQNGFLLNPEDFSQAREAILTRTLMEEEMGEGQPMDEWELYMWDLISSLE